MLIINIFLKGNFVYRDFIFHFIYGLVVFGFYFQFIYLNIKKIFQLHCQVFFTKLKLQVQSPLDLERANLHLCGYY